MSHKNLRNKRNKQNKSEKKIKIPDQPLVKELSMLQGFMKISMILVRIICIQKLRKEIMIALVVQIIFPLYRKIITRWGKKLLFQTTYLILNFNQRIN